MGKILIPPLKFILLFILSAAVFLAFSLIYNWGALGFTRNRNQKQPVAFHSVYSIRDYPALDNRKPSFQFFQLPKIEDKSRCGPADGCCCFHRHIFRFQIHFRLEKQYLDGILPTL